MNKGFQIEIQKDLTDEEKEEAIKFANKWISDVAKEQLSWAKAMGTEGGWHSWYKRGTLGHRLDTKSNLYFRRASRTKRIFQIVHKDNIKLAKDKDGDSIMKSTTHLNRWGEKSTIKDAGEGCMCPTCTGMLKVTNKYGDTETSVYCTIGEISG